MKHEEYKIICEEAKTAVLFIHGIIGTPNHFSRFIPLVPDNMSIYNMLLDGHGGSVRDFSHTSMKKWETQVQNAVNELASTHEKIYIVAHSMGTLFAIEQAVKNEKIAKLFLLAVPLKLFLKFKMLTSSLKVFFNHIRPDDLHALAAKNCYGIAQDRNPFHYIGWISRYLELFSKIRSVRKILPSLNVPCFAYQSRKDEMVSVKSAKILAQNPYINVTELENSGHNYYEKYDFEYLINEFTKFLISNER